jgi:hypothetical protein
MQVENPTDFEVVLWKGISEIGIDLLIKRYGCSFEQLKGSFYVTKGWSRDGKSYYYGPAAVRDRDYDTMEIIDCLYAKDKNGRFCGDLQIREIEAAREEAR